MYFLYRKIVIKFSDLKVLYNSLGYWGVKKYRNLQASAAFIKHQRVINSPFFQILCYSFDQPPQSQEVDILNLIKCHILIS